MIARPMPLEGIASNQRVVEEVIEGGKHFEAPVTRTTGFLAMSNDVCALDGLLYEKRVLFCVTREVLVRALC